MRRVVGLAIGLVWGAWMLACGSADEHPLGGPYGGSTNGAQQAGSSGGGGDGNTTCTSGAACPGGENIQVCTTVAAGACAGVTYKINGQSFACDSCTDCTQATTDATAACSAGSTSGGASSGGSSSGGSSGSGSSTSSSSSGGSTSSSSSGGSTSSSGGSSSGGTAAPTWSQLYGKYLANGTVGRCPQCHSSTGSAGGAYNWLKNKGYISGTSSALADPNQSCLSWYGGNMPPSGPSSNANATKDMNAWAAAGAPNN